MTVACDVSLRGPACVARRRWVDVLAARVAVGLVLLVLGACASAPHDYRAYLAHMPRSVLVLPPLDESPEVDADLAWLATVTRPLAERGYYVFPVALVQRILRENGLPTAHEMHAVSLAKLREVFGADAVMYVTLTRWGTSYSVLDSSTEVTYHARLVDLATGAELWAGTGRARRSSGDGGGGLLGSLVNAVVHQVVASTADPTPGVARDANRALFGDGRRGLLLGPYHPGHEEDQVRRREEQAEHEERTAAAGDAP